MAIFINATTGEISTTTNTPEQDAINATTAFLSSKRSKLVQSEIAMNTALAAGFQPTGKTYRLRGEDLQLITASGAKLVNKMMQAMLNNTMTELLATTVVIPVEGGTLEVSVAEAVSSYNEYGDWSEDIIALARERAAQISAATTQEDLDAIVII